MNKANGSTEIVAFAFNGVTTIRQISIPESITTIGNAAFYNMPNLATITVDENNLYYS